jgi:hypothetical protein
MRDQQIIENITDLKLLETGLTNENFIHEEIQGRLHSGNACC